MNCATIRKIVMRWVLPSMAILLVFGCGSRIGKSNSDIARLIIEVEPVSAIVLVDEVPALRVKAGRPGSITMQPGKKQIKVEADGYRTYRSTVEMSGGENVELSVELWPKVPELD